MLTLDRLYHRLTDRPQPLLDNVSFHLRSSEVVALLGRSGSGKTTLLQLIAGIEPLQSGDICLAEQRLSDLDDDQRTLVRRRQIGMVFQQFNLIPSLTVAENIGLPLALNAWSKRTQKSAVTDALQSIGLEGRQHDYPDRLSGGEQQRVAAARALVHRPQLVLADEPTGSLDAESGQQLLTWLLSQTRATGSALLLVTHSLVVARQADRIIALEGGKLRVATADLAW